MTLPWVSKSKIYCVFDRDGFGISLHFILSLQSAICILYLVSILYPVCNLQSAACILYWWYRNYSCLFILFHFTIFLFSPFFSVQKGVQKGGSTFCLHLSVVQDFCTTPYINYTIMHFVTQSLLILFLEQG